ncbi:MAG TPA: sensor domain-containing diguanylate cyclase, partial [Pirellulaceae bacterium]|nr:sensor domain-containing diguanylate cyclase [Pirellulaceae bacterium]
QHRRPLVNANPRVEFEAAGVPPSHALASAIVAPLQLGERVIGSLALFDTAADRYTDDHRRLLGRIAEQAAAVISNALVFEQTQEDSLTDPLTNLPNRRSMMARLTSEISRAERLQGELSVVVLDVDDFKRINDSYGHAVGDEVLREVAHVLLGSLRSYDMCVRFAGDEFVVVLGDCPPDAAELKRQELQRRIQEIAIQVDGSVIRVGASAGAANYPHDGQTYDALLATADRRMYADKAHRRNYSLQFEPQPEPWKPPVSGAVRPTRPN